MQEEMKFVSSMEIPICEAAKMILIKNPLYVIIVCCNFCYDLDCSYYIIGDGQYYIYFHFIN